MVITKFPSKKKQSFPDSDDRYANSALLVQEPVGS